MGIALTPSIPKDAAAAKAFDALNVSAFVAAQTTREDEAVDAPTAAMEAFRASHASELAAIKAAALSSAPVVWETDIQRLFAAPLPSLLSLRSLQALLALDAL